MFCSDCRILHAKPYYIWREGMRRQLALKQPHLQGEENMLDPLPFFK
jgi:hypothetical protein